MTKLWTRLKNWLLGRGPSYHPGHKYQPWARPDRLERAKIALHGHQYEMCLRPATGVYVIPQEFGTLQGKLCDSCRDKLMAKAAGTDWAKYEGLALSKIGTTKSITPGEGQRPLLVGLGLAVAIGVLVWICL